MEEELAEMARKASLLSDEREALMAQVRHSRPNALVTRCSAPCTPER